MTPQERLDTGVLVVGAGFLGCRVAAGFLEAGSPVSILARSEPNQETAGRLAGARILRGDAGDSELFEDALADHCEVVWCAGGLLPHESKSNPARDLIGAVLPLLGALEVLTHHRGVGLTFFSSGGALYGNPVTLPVPEVHPAHPLTPYAVSKATAEQYLALYHELHGIPSLVLRCSNVYGPGQRGNRSQGFIAAALEAVRAERPVVVLGDGSAVRDYIHVGDVVDVLLALAGRRDLPRVVNLGTGHGTSIHELLGLIGEVTGRPVSTETRPRRLGDVERIVLDITVLRTLMPFCPRELRDGLAVTWSELQHDAH